MTLEEFTKAMTFLGMNYINNKGFAPEHIKMLYPRFMNYSNEQFKNAVHECIENEKHINNITHDLGQYLPYCEQKQNMIECTNDFIKCPKTKNICPLDKSWAWLVIKFD